MNGYNFTERVRKILAMAREEAARLHHEYVGTEHILLGLIREGEGVAAAVLQSLTVDMDELRQTTESILKPGDPKRHAGPDLPYTSRAKKVLELAMTEARELKHSYVGTEHLLLGLIREEKGIAAQVLADANVLLPVARAETIRLLGSDARPASPRTPERRLWPNTASALDPSEDATESDTPQARSRRRLRSLPPAEWATDRARTVIGRARAAAVNRHSRNIEPEHLLIALLQEDGGMARTILERLAMDRQGLERAAAGAIEESLATDEPFDLEIPYSDSAEGVLRHAFQEARAARDRRIGTDHLLLGLLRESSAPASRVLSEAGLSADVVRAERQAIAG
jgi:ATP-dependent Clp protease ATP-binding subunit ClpA